ncbi:MAG: precorrin-4 C(11)-methyltransferase [Pseudomonadota bacterium]
MTVHFIGAGPGDPDLITVKGLRLIRACPLCLYAGSLVPPAVVAEAGADWPGGAARIVDTAPLDLDQILTEIAAAHAEGWDIARVHSGDPSLYGAVAEQIRRLEALSIPYEITPGVPAYAAAAAAMGRELTIPEVAQTVILTRTAMKSSAMPPGEELENLARTRATLAIHLSIRNLREIERVLIPHYGAECPAIVAYRVGWPDQAFLQGTLSTIREQARAAKITRTALIFVGRALAPTDGRRPDFRESALYDPNHAHILRPERAGGA